MATSEKTSRSRYQARDSQRYPVRPDAPLWRYFGFEMFCWLIEKASLYHARLDCLGDPYEGSVTVQYARKRDSGEIDSYMPFPELEPLNNRRLMLSSYATCWHASDDESPAMWKLYAHEQRGVAIVSTFARLRAAVDTSGTGYPMLGPVEYFDFDNDDMSLSLALTARPGFSKRRAFEHEREIRGLLQVPDRPADANDLFSESYVSDSETRNPLGVDAPVDLRELVAEIVVSPAAGAWFRELVQIVAERKGLAGAVRPSRLLDPPVY